MKLESLTVAQLQDLDEISPELALIGRRLLAASRGYDEWADVLELDLLECVKMLEEDPQVREKDGEDRLTAELITMLRSRSYDASHDEKVGGHSDIVVRHAKGFLWLGEAKIHKDYDYLMRGFNQLCTRYSRGTPDADRGGLIIYARVKNVASVVAEWRARLSSAGVAKLRQEDCKLRPQIGFRTTHEHDSSGRDYKVWHVGVVLHFDPKDVKGKDAPVVDARK
ncbi:hypothetical protein P5X00_14585 [Paraburkholderia sp. A2RO-4L]|uniref:hypothetical protein n=1 Tax=Paraburkholderia sp. A2RO-4L TaxID=3028374 RepID=UPI003DA88A22